MENIKFIDLYSIILSNDRNYCVHKDEAGEYFLNHKGNDASGKLVFYSEAVAQNYINKYLDVDKYKPERYVCNVNYLPDDIIQEV